MILWIIFAAMTAITLTLLLWPLIRQPSSAAPRAAYDLEIYRDQLAELERDQARGLIAADQAAAARSEIGRRILAVDSGHDGPVADPRPRAKRWSVITVAVAVPLCASLLYLQIGTPRLPEPSGGRPSAAQSEPDTQRADEMARVVKQLADRLKSEPNNAEGWVLLGRSLASMRRYAEAAVALGNAVALSPGNADLRSRQGEALTFANQGAVTPRARELFDAALAADPKEPRARYYLGLAEMQAGRLRTALDGWMALEAESPSDAPWRAILVGRIEQLATRLEVDLTALRSRAPDAAPDAAPAPPRGPSAADVDAARQMSPGDRKAMIRSMVEGLAQRLQDEPDDVDGWLRLARSYQVLGDPGKSRDAYAEAARRRPNDVTVLTGYAASIMRAAAPETPPPPAFRTVVADILRLDPNNRNALWLAGIAAQQGGDDTGARRYWVKLRGLLEPGSSEHRELGMRIEALGGNQ